jgi:integrase
MKAKSTFTEPILCHYNFNMKKDWFVYFRYPDISGKKILLRFKAGINYEKEKRERIKAGNALRDALSYKLNNENWNPLLKETPIQHKILSKVLDDIMNIKKSSMKPKSIRTYQDIVNMFKKWLTDNGHNIYPQQMNNIIARAYMDYLLKDRNYSGKSHNSQLGILITFFNCMIEREIIEKNPFKGIKELPEEVGKNFPFTFEEKNELRDLLKEGDQRLYLFSQFIYYGFIRRSELIQLKAGHIDWENKTIIIHSGTSKNRRQMSVTIPVSFEAILLNFYIDKLPKDWYIFSHLLEPGPEMLKKADYITWKHRKIMDVIHIGKEKGLYSWKHTGVVDLYNATKDPYVVMNQCRHSDIKITMLYLRSLGLQTNEKIRSSNFTF